MTIQINKLLDTVVKQNASDIHLAVGQKPTIRLHGKLMQLQTNVLTPDDTMSLMKSISPERKQQELQEEGSADFGFAFEDKARFRVAIFKQKQVVGMVMRLIPYKLLTFDELGLSTQIQGLLAKPRGLFLVTGPTGSGKTTTLATMIDHINSTMDHHIITIEDPVEYYHSHKKSLITQRELGVDVPSFAEGLRRALRQDPDVVLVGEMRDLETMEAAITAAETGHLVFATLHTTGAQGTVNRIVDAFPQEQQEQVRTQLSVALLAIVSQQLLPRASGKGRIAAYEILVMTAAIANLIRENKTYRIDSAIQTGKKHGMELLDDNLFNLYRRGLVKKDEILNRCKNTEEVLNKVMMFDQQRAADAAAAAGQQAAGARHATVPGK